MIYPIHLFVLYSLKRKNKSDFRILDENLPFVSCIISVYNESSVIVQKIQSILDSDYPKDKLLIYVGSDASTDESNMLLMKLSGQYPEIKFFHYPVRRGKTLVINDLIDEAFRQNAKDNNHILLFTDANVILNRGVIKQLCRHFNDHKVALVDSKIIPYKTNHFGISNSENEYMNLEIKIKYWEGELWGSMMGAFGGCFALRSDYFEKVPSNFIVDDFFITMNALKKGGLSKNDLEAICYEGKPDHIAEEFRRKARISAGNFQNLAYFSDLLFKKPLTLSYSFFSHKVLRWTAPVYLSLALIALIILVIMDPDKYLFFLEIILLIILILPLLDILFAKFNIHLKVLRGNRYFIMMNIALLFGFIRYLYGIKKSSWEPPKRNLK